MKPPRATPQKCPCGAERRDGKPLCNRHMAQADEQLVKRWFNRAKRLRKDPTSAEALAGLRETTEDLHSQIR